MDLRILIIYQISVYLPRKKKRSRTKKSEKNDFAFLFNYKLIIILKKE
jgi:hypothetical protein